MKEITQQPPLPVWILGARTGPPSRPSETRCCEGGGQLGGGCAVENCGGSGSGQDHGAGSAVDGQHEEDGRELSRTETKEWRERAGGPEQMTASRDRRRTRMSVQSGGRGGVAGDSGSWAVRRRRPSLGAAAAAQRTPCEP